MSRGKFLIGSKQCMIILVALTCVAWNVVWNHLTEREQIVRDTNCLISIPDFVRSQEHSENSENKQESTSKKKPNNNGWPQESPNKSKYNFDETKKILLYTPFFTNTKEWPHGDGHDPFVDHKCPVSNCYMTMDRSALPSVADFDAVVFNMWHNNILKVDGNKKIKLDLPSESQRKPSQRYVLFLGETAGYAAKNLNAKMMNGIFNWTMSYRLSSDQTLSWGWIDPIDQFRERPPNARDPPFEWKEFSQDQFLWDMKADEDLKNELEPLAKRPNKIAWLTSHCDTLSQRMDYVDELKKHVEVKVFGACGEECGRKGQLTSNCTELIERDYKFYLSFENSFCEDYVSEKFWRTMSKYLVPIVMGSAKYDKLAPPHSYINALDYPNPKALAEYIKFVDKNPEEYLSYFWWKSQYEVRQGSDMKFSAWCELCRMLHDANEPVKVFNEFDEMIKCHSPPWNKKDWKK